MLCSKLGIKPRKNKPCNQDTENQIRVMKQIPQKPGQISGQNVSGEISQADRKDFSNNY